ncbi:IS4 family transposase [Kribbella sp. NPDC056951]|uniref:IS4 family transposase n=1 Tax=Kribbella sp. NPDC056951 TaxID=3345978 RepID=UPI00363ABA58
MVRVASGRFAPGHLGELTQIVPFEMVDEVLASNRRVQARVRDLPSRVVVYLLLAAALFSEMGYGQVWARLVSGLDGLDTAVAAPSSSALSQARRRVGVAPLRALFDLLAGPPAGAPRWRGWLLCAIDGTALTIPNGGKNVSVYGHHPAGPHGDSGYPILRLLAVVACGTRTIIGVVFGSCDAGETTYAARLTGCLRPGMLLLADRNFAVTDLFEAITGAGAGLLIRCKNNRRLKPIQRCSDGTWLTRVGALTLRVIEAEIHSHSTDGPTRIGRYRLLTTLTDHHRYPAHDLIELYHHRWEIETTYLEMKSTTLHGRVLRARTPDGITQEVYALLTAYQALRIAIADATLTHPGTPPDRGSFTIALNTARDQIIHAAGVITATTIDLIGKIGRTVLNNLLPNRRARTSPRIVKRAKSKYRATTTTDRNTYKTTHTIHILDS